jgi:hypothetical protein
MTSSGITRSIGSRALLEAAATVAIVAAFAFCAYAGGQARRTPAAATPTAKPTAAPAQAVAAQKGGINLKQIKSSADSGKAAKKGPSANVGQEIRILGTGFDDNVAVEFTAFANSTFNIHPLDVKEKKLDVKVPNEVITGGVKLIDPDTGTSNTATLQIVPVIQKLSQETIAPGGQLLIDGTGFTRDSRVEFAGIKEPVVPTIVSPTRIDIVVPAGAKSGRIVVVTPGGRSKPAKLKVGAGS